MPDYEGLGDLTLEGRSPLATELTPPRSLARGLKRSGEEVACRVVGRDADAVARVAAMPDLE